MQIVVRWLGFVAVCLMGVLWVAECVAECVAGADDVALRWAPPVLEDAKTIELTNVYVTPAARRPLDRSVWPDRNDREFGARLSEDGKCVSWPNLPFVTGEVLLGPPPEGDFVPDGVAGSDYQSPGYQAGE